MNQLTQLYKQTVLEHNRNPRNFGELAPPCQHTEAFNPLCGDKLEVFFRLGGATLNALTFTGVGCALSQASASMMTEALQGLTVTDAQRLIDQFVAALGPEPGAVEDLPGDLRALLEARQFPSRINCVLLGWRALGAALAQPSGGDQ